MNNARFHQWALLISLVIIFSNIDAGLAQNLVEDPGDLPFVNGAYIDGVQKDYLIEKFSEEVEVFRNERNNEMMLVSNIGMGVQSALR